MELPLHKAREAKDNDVRLVERQALVGKLDKKAHNAQLAAMEDCASNSQMVNLDELMANDNPVHVGRNLPALTPRTPQPFEDLEFEEQANRFQFEH